MRGPALTHRQCADSTGLLDWDWQDAAGIGPNWPEDLRCAEGDAELVTCTYAGRPFGDSNSVTQAGERFGRQ